MKDLENKTIVITGASSGIGRATALMAAEQGAAVVLVSRQKKALKDVARDCRAMGGVALVAAADVTDEDAIRKVARDAYRRFGHIDAWVNNAAVSMFARFEEAPPEDYRRVIETNLYGYFNGARAVLPYFREQGGGVLINVSSVVGRTGAPNLSAYTTSKFAINGWSESLRMELRDAPGIQVCTVLPASIDTPIFQHAANYTGRAVKPLPPVYPPELVAEAILKCIRKPEREVFAGSAGSMLARAKTLAPGAAERLMARQVAEEHFQDVFEEPHQGNLYRPMKEFNAITGGWREREPAADGGAGRLAGFAAIAAGLGTAGVLLARNRRKVSQKGKKVARKSREVSNRTRRTLKKVATDARR